MVLFKAVATPSKGTTPNMEWVQLESGLTALRKNVTWDQIRNELDTIVVCKFFDVPVSKVIVFDEHSLGSVVSYNKRYTQIHGYELCSHCLEEYHKVLPQRVYDDLLKVCFVDCVCGQTDRNSGNIAFLKNVEGAIVGVCPLYDNIVSFGYDIVDDCLLAPTMDKVWYDEEVFKWLSENQKDFNSLRLKYESQEFTKLTSNLYNRSWVLEQRERLLSSLD